MKIQKW